MVHAAKPSYYESVGRYVEARESDGSIVHFEASFLPDDEQLASYPDWVGNNAKRLDKALHTFMDCSDEDDVVPQYDTPSFTIKDSWEIHDLNTADAVMALGMIRTWVAVKTLERFVAIGEGTKKERPLLDAASDLLLLKVTDRVIIDKRNDIALQGVEGALHANPDQDITLLWGSFHLPGLAKGILKMDYAHTDTFWQQAVAVEDGFKF